MNGPKPQHSTASAALVDDGIEELRQRVAELTLAVEARDTFIAVAGYELRNPMTPIIGQLEHLHAAVATGRCPLEQVGPRLERIQQTVRHYVRRAAVVLDVSRITNGTLRLEAEPFDLVPLLQGIASDFAAVAQRAGIPFTLTVPSCLLVTWDRLAAEQVVDNLLSNAIRYGARTPVEMSVQQQDGQVRIQVCDHGRGIPPVDRDRVSACFEQAVGPGERRSGFGVGLWLVGRLVAAMDGTVLIEDAPGGGALFTLTLPQQGGSACL